MGHSSVFAFSVSFGGQRYLFACLGPGGGSFVGYAISVLR